MGERITNCTNERIGVTMFQRALIRSFVLRRVCTEEIRNSLTRKTTKLIVKALSA